MPELPEVEIIKNQLKNTIINKKVKKIFKSNLTFRGKYIPEISGLLNQKILNIYRINKYLIIEFTDFFCVIHLGMTGQVIYSIESFNNLLLEKHIHLILNLGSDVIYFKDVRRFGGVFLYNKQEYSNYMDIPLFSNLGTEPLDKNFTLNLFSQLVHNSKGDCKKFLMDGSKVCGIGNIYANEILFLSNINPNELVENLNDKDIATIYNNIIKILNTAIELGGSSISDFVHTNGLKGSMQDFYKVYSRQGEPCYVCEHSIIKIKQHGRSSFYCPCCQKLKK